jgi:ornithine carbamoyltransferase
MKHLIDIHPLQKQDLWNIFHTTAKVKEFPERYRQALAGKTLAMIFQKASTRTRVSFEVGMYQLGGLGLYFSSNDLQIGRGEPIEDTARVLSRYVDGIMARVFDHQLLLDMARHGSVPVINGLSDLSHPCQALADFFTIWEKKGRLENLKVAYIGDGNNMAHSLLETAVKLGIHFAAAIPSAYAMKDSVFSAARQEAEKTGACITLTENPLEAARQANVIYTDVWASMGQEGEAERRRLAFQGFQVDTRLMDAGAPDCQFMHCLPAHRGEEVSNEVIESERSIVFDQAENRLHVQKAILLHLMQGC